MMSVQHISHYAMGTPSFIFLVTNATEFSNKQYLIVFIFIV